MSRGFGAQARAHVSRVMDASFGIVGFLRSQGALSGAAPIAVAAALRGKGVADFADELAQVDDPSLSGFELAQAGEETLASLAKGEDLDEFCEGLDSTARAAVGPRFGSVTDGRLARASRARELGLALEEYDAALAGTSVEDVLRSENADIVAARPEWGESLVTGRVEELAKRRGKSRRVYSRGIRDFAAKAAAADIEAASRARGERTEVRGGEGATERDGVADVGKTDVDGRMPPVEASPGATGSDGVRSEADTRAFMLDIDEMERLVLEGAVSASEKAVDAASEQAKAADERIAEMTAAVEVVVDY